MGAGELAVNEHRSVSGPPLIHRFAPRYDGFMLVIHVHVHVKPEFVEAFRQATIENARQSVQEPGVARFDIIEQADDPARFVLVEVYRTAEAPARHKETPHYQAWRDTVADMLVTPRTSVKYANVFPGDQVW